MMKRSALVIVVILILALAGTAVFAMSMRRAHMMGGGSQIELSAVSADGEQILPPADVIAITGELPKGTSAQVSGGMIVSLALSPYPPSVGQGEFDVTLTDVNGQPVDDATISLDLTMPAMRMPPNKPEMEFVADGKYHAAAYYTMRGWWRIEVIITRGNEQQSVFFDVGL